MIFLLARNRSRQLQQAILPRLQASKQGATVAYCPTGREEIIMNEVQKFKSLIELGNTAKNCGAYEVANDVFAVLIFGIKETIAKSSKLTPADAASAVYVETQCEDADEWLDYNATDPHGYGYYDLPTIHMDGALICIPLPLLSQAAIDYIAALPNLEIDYRSEHGRNHFRLNAERSEIAERDLCRRLNAFVTADVLEEARQWGLDAYQGEEEAVDIVEV